MLYVTVDLSASREDWHLNTLGRIIKGIKGLEKEGFKVERYGHWNENGATEKWLLTISRDDSAGDDESIEI